MLKVDKNTSIETLRGIAVILMVSGHVIGAKSTDGLKVGDTSYWRFFYYAFEYIRMPLFTVISGYIYAYKPLSKFSSNGKFIWGKVNRLLIPLVVVSTLFYVIQHFTPGTNYKNNLADIRFIYFYPYAHFWFLQGMMIVFLIIVILENLDLLKTLKSSVLCLTVFVLIFILFPYKFNNFSAHKVPFLLTFFTFGLILKRFHDVVFQGWILKIAGAIFVLAFVCQLYLFNHDENIRIDNLLAFLVGCTACLLLIKIEWRNSKLIWLGAFSYGIYLFHILGSVASRIIMSKLAIHNSFIQVISGVCVGVAVPVIIQLILGRYKLFSVAFFGDKIDSKKPLIMQKESNGLIYEKPNSGSTI